LPVEVETDGTLIERSARGRPDAFVEVWVRAFAGRGGYDPAYPDARPWLFGIARNVLQWHWRSARAADHPSGAGQAVAEDPWDAVIDRLDGAARSRALLAAVRALPPAERDVLLLVAWEQLTPAQAATALGVPQGTARSRLYRARTALRLALATNPAEEEP